MKFNTTLDIMLIIIPLKACTVGQVGINIYIYTHIILVKMNIMKDHTVEMQLIFLSTL
jgi:hypothetical protein